MKLEGYVLKQDEFNYLRTLLMLLNDEQRHLLINSVGDKASELDEEIVIAYWHYVRKTDLYVRRNSDGKLTVLGSHPARGGIYDDYE